MLRKEAVFRWDENCDRALEEVKKFLSTPPLLSLPTHGEPLYLYISNTDTTLASVLVREEAGEVIPVYYVSKMLRGPEIRYTPLEKLAYVVVTTVKKLKHYFQAHTIFVRTQYPLKKVLQKADTLGRLMEWSLRLGEFDIKYVPGTTLKAQILADFVAECSVEPGCTSGEEDSWHLFVDGANGAGGAGIGVVLKGPHKLHFRHSIHLDFPVTNNIAEYTVKDDTLLDYRWQERLNQKT